MFKVVSLGPGANAKAIPVFHGVKTLNHLCKYRPIKRQGTVSQDLL